MIFPHFLILILHQTSMTHYDCVQLVSIIIVQILFVSLLWEWVLIQTFQFNLIPNFQTISVLISILHLYGRNSLSLLKLNIKAVFDID